MFGLLEVKEAAAAMKISKSTLRAWIFQKKIPCVHLGRRVLIRHQDIEDMIRRGLVEARKGA